MTAELLAHNVAAHWMQAGAVAGTAWLGVSVLRLHEPGFLLKYWQAVLLVLLLAPWIQPWQAASATPAHGLPLVGPERESAGVAGVSVVESVVALPAERWSVDPWTWVLGLLAAVAVFRLARLGLGLVRLGRLARSADRVAPPAPAQEFLARFRDVGRLRSAAGCPDALQFRAVPPDRGAAGRLRPARSGVPARRRLPRTAPP